MKSIIIFLFFSKTVFNSDTNRIAVYYKNIYLAEDKFLHKQYDSSYYFYLEAFKHLNKINPKINGHKSDVENFYQLQVFCKKTKEFENIWAYNKTKVNYNVRLQKTIDSLHTVDQNVRDYRTPNATSDALRKKINIVDERNFSFLYELIKNDFPTEYEIPELSYSNLKTLMLHAAYIDKYTDTINNLVLENINKGVINPRLYINVISKSIQNIGFDVGLIHLGYYDQKAKTEVRDYKDYKIKLSKAQIEKMNLAHEKFYLPTVSHIIKCSCYKFKNPKSNMDFHVMVNYFSYIDYNTYKANLKAFETFKCFEL